MIFPSDSTANWIRARLDGLLPRDELLPRDLLLYYDGSDAAYDAHVDRLVEVLQERYPPPSQFSPSGRVVRQTFAPAAPLPHLVVPRLSPPPRPTSGIPDVSPPPDALRTPTEAARKPRKPRKPTPEYLATLANKPGVARVEMKPDGTVLVTTGDSSAVDNNPWDVAAAALRQKKELQ